MPRQLFRQEMMDAQRAEWLGPARLVYPKVARTLVFAALIITTALIVFLFFAKYARSEHVFGVLQPKGGLVRVSAALSGNVIDVRIKQGDVVEADDPLLTVSSDHSSLSVTRPVAAVSEQLSVERTKIDADIHAAATLAERKQSDLLAKIRNSESQIELIKRQLEGESTRVNRASGTLNKIKALVSKGYISELQIQEQEETVESAENQVLAVRRSLLDIQQQLANQKSELAQLPLATAASLHDLERRRAEIERSLTENEAIRGDVVRASSGGAISSLMVKLGQTVERGKVLLTIVPKDSQLQAELFLPSRSVGMIAPGATVSMNYTPYPYQTYGYQTGKVLTISSTPLTAEQVESLTGSPAQEPMYQVEVEINQQTLHVNGQEILLKPGTTVDAEILLERRPLIEWLLPQRAAVAASQGGFQRQDT